MAWTLPWSWPRWCPDCGLGGVSRVVWSSLLSRTWPRSVPVSKTKKRVLVFKTKTKRPGVQKQKSPGVKKKSSPVKKTCPGRGLGGVPAVARMVSRLCPRRCPGCGPGGVPRVASVVSRSWPWLCPGCGLDAALALASVVSRLWPWWCPACGAVPYVVTGVA